MREALIAKIKKLRGEGPALCYEQQLRISLCKRRAEAEQACEAKKNANGTWKKFRLTIPLFDIAVVAAVWCLIGALFGKK